MTDSPQPNATVEPDDLPDDEADLRRRLAGTRAARPKVEEFTVQISGALQVQVGRMAGEIKQGTVSPNAKEVLAVNEALTKMSQALHETWVTMGEEEARIRQALALITTERHTEATIEAAQASNTLADAANRQTAALVQWTKWLATATVALAVATIVLVVVTATSA